MSYCRFGYGSDVYAYSDIRGGYTIHVAVRRCRLSEEDYARLFEEVHAAGPDQSGYLRLQEPYDDIGLGHDGEDFYSLTAKAARDCLIWLGLQGYVVPWYAIERLNLEAKWGPVCRNFFSNSLGCGE